jgi:LysM repeat protein
MLVVACRPKELGLPTLTPTPSRDVPTATSTPMPPTPTSTPIVYVVQPGDSLSVIATKYDVSTELLAEANGIDDPNVIAVGQELIIPGPTSVPTATVLPTETPTPDVPPQLEIVDVIGRGAPSAETVIIVNQGRDVLLHRWTLRDAQGNAYVFPNVYLVSGAELRVHTGPGEDMPQHLYWNREVAVWEEAGDVAVLADERGVMYAAKPLD